MGVGKVPIRSALTHIDCLQSVSYLWEILIEINKNLLSFAELIHSIKLILNDSATICDFILIHGILRLFSLDLVSQRSNSLWFPQPSFIFLHKLSVYKSGFSHMQFPHIIIAFQSHEGVRRSGKSQTLSTWADLFDQLCFQIGTGRVNLSSQFPVPIKSFFFKNLF